MLRSNRSIRLVLALAVSALAFPEAASADSISITNTTYQESQAHDSISSFVHAQHTLGASAPQWTQTTTATDSSVYGTSSATVASVLDQSSFDLSFDFQTFHRTTNSTWGESLSRGTIHFMALEDLQYELSGSIVQSGAGGAHLVQVVRLIENATATYFVDQTSSNTATSHTLTGSGLTGALVAGRTYQLQFEYRLAHNFYNQTRTASGDLSLAFTAVPEPATGLALGMGLLALGVSRRHRPTPS